MKSWLKGGKMYKIFKSTKKTVFNLGQPLSLLYTCLL